MRIAWIHSFPQGERSAPMGRLASVLARRGHALRIFDTGPLNNPRQLARAVRRLSRETQGADIVHAQYGSGCALVASRLPGKKILSVRGSNWYGLRSRRPGHWLHSWMDRRLTCLSFRCYDLVLAVSERLRGEILESHPSLRIEVLQSGIDLEAFRPMPRERARATLGERDDAPWALLVTPCRPLQRLALAKAAVAIARREIPNLRLVCIEGKPLPELRDWINASNAVLLTSTREGWPTIVKEALACGVPFISTDVSDLRRIAEVEPACRVTDDTPESLARGLVESLHHGRHDGLRLHVQPFDLEWTADRLIHWYRALAC